MARVKQSTRQYEKGVITWTRFHLPLEKEWPTWAVPHDDVHVGPLADVKGVGTISLARMVRNPEQAAYIIVWDTMEDIQNFEASPACREFLQNLPDNSSMPAAIESASALSHLTLNDGPSSSSSMASPLSRLCTLKHVKAIPTAELEGRVTLNLFLIPRKDDISTMMTWYQRLKEVLGCFLPRGFEFVKWRPRFSWQYLTLWFWVVSEDQWIEKAFGKLENPQGEESQGRTIICEFHVWPIQGADLEQENALATDPQTRESWSESVARVMPPVTAWQQERWDARQVPRFLPPEEIDPEDSECEKELDEMRDELGEKSED
ncbi:hypothetical protein PFICI_14992 [Pestalotiopsis fici W106-1]|uniref:ABM domain-containing protein n=1 Tax=Pestalotiopsis fici (strain W106-1 / CGMCC3.15140) TaxID=1229662 RepID=W3WJS0_PESFW|nr:uncharacterized protein PFICI_14992 [Pestalotiopsis fici W106-1]ETS73387.1 hypothetical protein PFICI_14992 [Pestalotiopsis fici W106-1]